MFCPNCGKKLADDSKFCPDCGTKISGTTTRKRKSSQETDSSEPKEVIQAEDDSMKEDNKKSKDWKSFFIGLIPNLKTLIISPVSFLGGFIIACLVIGILPAIILLAIGIVILVASRLSERHYIRLIILSLLIVGQVFFISQAKHNSGSVKAVKEMTFSNNYYSGPVMKDFVKKYITNPRWNTIGWETDNNYHIVELKGKFKNHDTGETYKTKVRFLAKVTGPDASDTEGKILSATIEGVDDDESLSTFIALYYSSKE